jgi:hypothetical protein
MVSGDKVSRTSNSISSSSSCCYPQSTRTGPFKHPPPNNLNSRFMKSAALQNGVPQIDEQIGETFTQSFTSLAYNVTAVAQVDADGFGPAYLLNGLSDTGYWYQVGLAYNWDPQNTPGTGFDFAYEVWSSNGSSVLPGASGSGLLVFSGPVNSGDNVLLDLYFGSGQVVMLAIDHTTGSRASETYSAEGATQFVGDTSMPSNTFGFFTGLMTEQYHYLSYYGGEGRVTYSDPYYALTSSWMWIDEFNVNTSANIFGGTSGIVSYTSNPNAFQSFTLQGAFEASNAYSLVTGQSSQALLSLSYSTQDGSAPPSNLQFSYYSGGTLETTTLSTFVTVVEADVGTSWKVSENVSSNGQEWEDGNSTSGNVSVPQSLNFVYYHEYNVSFLYRVVGGGIGYSAPLVQYSYLGKPTMTRANSSSAWVDAGSTYFYSSPLPGSTLTERWVVSNASSISGIVSTRDTSADVSYVHQFYASFAANSQSGGSVPLSSGWYSAGSEIGLTEITSTGWHFEIWVGYGTSAYNGSSHSQIIALSSPINETANFYVGVTLSSGGGGSISYTDGAIRGSVSGGTSSVIYVPPGSALSILGVPSSFLQEFRGWSGNSSLGSAPNVILNPVTPLSIGASFGYNYLMIGLVVVVGIVIIVGGLLYYTLVRRKSSSWVPLSGNEGSTT